MLLAGAIAKAEPSGVTPNVTYDPKVKVSGTFEPAEDTSRTSEAAEAAKAATPPSAPAEVKARSNAFTVYKPPPAAKPPSEPEPTEEASAALPEEAPAAEGPSGSSAAGSSGAVGTLTGPVVSTVLNGEHSPQAVRDALPFLPKIKINGGGSGTIKLGH